MMRLMLFPWRWLTGRLDYLHFKYKQFQNKRKAKKADPDIYPLW